MRTLLTLCVVAGLAGCSTSSTPGDGDATITFDAGPDLPTLEDVPAPLDVAFDGPPVESVCGNGELEAAEECDDGNTTSGDGCDMNCRNETEAVCGDGMLDRGEACDDGNTADGDGCSSTCRRESFCGDGVVDASEVCDDGNNMSGDGCRADCMSDETCGNGIRDVAAGEACDGEASCSMDCFELLSCGDGSVTDPETCDDSNTMPFDGCGADCQTERSLIISRIIIGDETQACDYSGDGVPDNAFAEGLGTLRSLANSMFLENAAANGDLIMLMHMIALDDPDMANDPSFTIAWLLIASCMSILTKPFNARIIPAIVDRLISPDIVVSNCCHSALIS